MNKNNEPRKLNPFENAIQHWLNFADPEEKEKILASLAGVDDQDFHPVKTVVYNAEKNPDSGEQDS